MLSNSYNVDVTYTDKFRNGEMIVESWFVKVPLSQKTFLLDEMEVFMYDKMIPMLQAFAAKVNFSRGQWLLIKAFHNDASTTLITKIALKTFLDYVCHNR